MIFNKAEHAAVTVVKYGDLHLNRAFRRDILSEECVYLACKGVLGHLPDGEHIVDNIVLDSPIGVNFIVGKCRMEHRRFLKKAYKHGLERLNIDAVIVVKLDVDHAVVEIAEKIVHLIPKLGIQSSSFHAFTTSHFSTEFLTIELTATATSTTSEKMMIGQPLSHFTAPTAARIM